jgi:hypothetical protein
MPDKRERCGELVREIESCMERVRSASRGMFTCSWAEYLSACDQIRIEAGKIARLSGQLRRLWAWQKRKGGA